MASGPNVNIILNLNIGAQQVDQRALGLAEASEWVPLLARFAALASRTTNGRQVTETEPDSPDGFYTSTTGKYVKYSDFIPGYLQPETQLALRQEMSKPVSESDESGYVYAYRIEDESSSDDDGSFLMRLKIGRAVDVQARLSSWQRHCRTKRPKLIGWYPGNIEDERLEAIRRRGRFKPGKKGKYCHKLERLVHIELADLAIHTPYLNSHLFNVASSPTFARAQAGENTPRLALNVLQQANVMCDGCRRVHKEVFPFVRPDAGPYKDHEWEMIVKPVIRKWGRFIKENF